MIAFLKNATFYKKIIALGLLILGSMLVITFLGIAIASLFWKDAVSGMLHSSDNMNYLSNIPLLKFLQAFSQIGTFVLPVVLFSLFTEGNVFKSLKMDFRLKGSTILFTVLLIISAVPFINLLLTLNGCLQLPSWLSGVENWIRSTEENAAVLTQSLLQVNTLWGLLVNLLIIALIPAVGEEMLFRGVIQSMLVKNLKNKHVAVWIAAIIFSAVHMQFLGFVPRMVLGLIMGYLFLWSGSLYLSMIAHFINNAFAVTLAYLSTINIIPLETSELGSSSGEWMAVLISIIFASVFFYLIFRSEKNKNKKRLSAEFEILP